MNEYLRYSFMVPSASAIQVCVYSAVTSAGKVVCAGVVCSHAEGVTSGSSKEKNRGTIFQ